MHDPHVVTVPETAFLLKKSPVTIRHRLKDDKAFAAAVVVSDAQDHRVEISVPRLARYVHGSEAEAVLPEWRERLGQMRAERLTQSRAS